MHVKLRTLLFISLTLATVIVFSAALATTLRLDKPSPGRGRSSGWADRVEPPTVPLSCPKIQEVVVRGGMERFQPLVPAPPQIVCPLETRYCTSSGNSGGVGAHHPNSFGGSSNRTDPTVPGVRLWKDHCLKPASDRLEIVSPIKAGVPDGQIQGKPGITFIASDLCAMGHTTKDPVTLLSALLDLIDEKNEEISRREKKKSDTTMIGGGRKGKKMVKEPLIIRVVYANSCMTKHPSASGGNKRTPVFHKVLVHWFRAVLHFFRDSDPSSRSSINNSVGREGDDADGDVLCPTGLDCRMCALLTHLQLKVGALYSAVTVIEEYHSTYASSASSSKKILPCFETVLKRDEHWRWTRTSAHAYAFRAMLHRYYNITSNQKRRLGSLIAGLNSASATVAEGGVTHNTEPSAANTPPLVKNRDDGNNYSPLQVTLLRRDEDRHFGEKRVYDFLKGQWAAAIGNEAVAITMIAFDNIRGKKGTPPPTHQEQLQILANTDILIAAHGAGLAGVVAMLPGTAVIELFPHNFRYPMYEELADVAGVTYLGIESPVIAPKGCCKGRGAEAGGLLPVLQGPSYVHGQGARACKKCDIWLSWTDVDNMFSTALHSVVHSTEQLCYSLMLAEGG